MGFVRDALFDVCRFRASLPRTTFYHFTHVHFASVVDQKLRGERVADAVTRLAAECCAPKAIVVDNCSEFPGMIMGGWAYENGFELDFSQRVSPTDKALVGRLNRRFRQEYLNEH